MADKKPIKATYSGTDTNGLAEFIAADTIGVADGGTGLTTVAPSNLLTGNGASALSAEANLTFDGSTLTVTGSSTLTGKASIGTTSPSLASGLFIKQATSDAAGGIIIQHSTTSTYDSAAIWYEASDGSLRIGQATAASGANAASDFINPVVFGQNGNVGIGVGTSAVRLNVLTDVATNYSAYFANVGNNANRYGINIQAGANDASGVTYYLNALDGDGDQVGYIENNSGTFRLVDGSDERGKENIVDTTVDGLATINAIEVKDFTRKKSGERVSAGFTAQQMQAAYPAAVSQPDDVPDMLYDKDVEAVLYEEGDDLPDGKSVGDVKTEAIKEGDVQTEGYTPWMGVGKDSLIGPLVKAVQQLSAKVTALESA